ncbi:MAG TPA: glycosyltransferase family 9 protein [Steroidobacteraceae bacterium]|nr:glycosyltransferase family 9 protein [Steroidobacteraceae bacterium]
MRRPLVVRFGALGDMVLMTVAIRALHERLGEPVDVLGSGAWTRPLLEGQRGVGDLYLMGSRHRPYWLAADQWRLVRDLRRRGAGPTWLFDAQNERTRGLLQRAGWGEENLVTLERLADIPGEHFCDHWWRFAQLDPLSLGGRQHAGSGPPAYPELRVSAEARAEVRRWLEQRGLSERPILLIQIGNKRTMRRGPFDRPSNTKYWPEGHWASLLRELQALHPEHVLLMLGVASEAPLNDAVLARAQLSASLNLAREMSVPRLMGLAERAAGMISVDTGPAHVAAALGCPLLTLFDSESKARMYAPRGPGGTCLRILVSRDAQPALLGITPQDVLAVWREMRLRSGEPAEGTAKGTLTNAIASPGAAGR